MGAFMLRRILYVIPALIAVSLISFLVIAIPPGDYVSRLAEMSAAAGDVMPLA